MQDSNTRIERLDRLEGAEPRWPALIALLLVGVMYLALPPHLVVGPRWLPLVFTGLLAIPAMVTFHRGHHGLNQLIGYLIEGFVTAVLISSVVLLIIGLPTGHTPLHEEPVRLLTSASVLWIANIIVFSLWYWRLDAGGPYARDLLPGHTDGAFLFPQMSAAGPFSAAETNWSPRYVDYLFLAFNTSTALSPADTAVLSRWAKLLMMLQALLSLTIVALLLARAINTLPA